MAKDVAVALVNQMKGQLAGLTRAIITAAADGKVSPSEGINLGLQGMVLASMIATLLQGVDAQTRQEVLTVLERGTFVYTE